MEKEPTVKFQVLREQAKARIMEMLEMSQGAKLLVIDPSLIGPLSLIIEHSVLKDHGVLPNIKPVEPGDMHFECRDVYYIVRPTIQMMQIISSQIKDSRENQVEKRYYLYMCPRVTTVCEKILTDNEVLGEFEVIEPLAIYLIPLEKDLISMQMESAFKDLVLERDFTMYHYIARAILQLEHCFGPIPVKEGKGVSSPHALRILKMLEEEDPEYINEHPLSEIQSIVLIDRETDMITPLCTPLTYEALLDEVFGIANNVVKVPPKVLEKDETDRDIKLSLTSADTVFQEIRDLNFCVLKPLLVDKLQYIDNTYKEKDKQKTVEELSKYMKKFKQAHKEASSVQNHLNLAIHITNTTIKDPFFNQNLDVEHSIIMGDTDSQVYDHIEALIGMEENLEVVLRLLCLLSQTQNGIKSKVYDFFRKEIVQTYGFQHIITISNLEKVGLIKRQETRSNWNTLKRNFQLINEDVNQRQPDDIAYAYAGYAPLSLRLLESLYTTGWNTDSVRSLAGDYYFMNYEIEEQSTKGKPVVVVFFLGGVTFAEVAAIRYLNSRPDAQREYVIATTHLINSNSFLSSVGELVQADVQKSSII